MENTLLIISGPTASGKSCLAEEWALQWKAPIISADSRQIFQRVNIGTGKPSAAMLQSVKHYLIDFLPVHATYNVGQYEKDACQLLEDLFKTSPIVVLCGGTGLYIKSIIHGLDNLPSSDKEIKDQLKSLYDVKGIEGFQKLLLEVDPDYYRMVDLKNSRRLERALEVFMITGKPYSTFRKKIARLNNFKIIELCLLPDREKLYQTINMRVDSMIRSGLVEETKELLEYRDCQSMNTVGYKEIISYLDGKVSLVEAIEQVKQHSRNYAKRQVTWFKKENQGYFVDPEDKMELKKIYNLLGV